MADQPYRHPGPGRFDKDGVEWFACDPYPTWFRWEGDQLIEKGYGDWPEEEDDSEEITPKAHKVFVFEKAGSPWIEMVTDERPLTRMTLQLLPDEARGIARALNDAADATDTEEVDHLLHD